MLFRILVTASAVVSGGSAVYLYLFHQRLASRIEHHTHRGTLSSQSPRLLLVNSVPEHDFTKEHFALHDHSSKQVSRDALPKNISPDQLFTRLVRRNMTAFSRLPQAWMIRLVSTTPEELQSFKASHLGSLNFDKGDLVCGAYRVVDRSENKVEFEIKMKNVDFFHGRLALGYREIGDHIVFSSETFMWRRTEERRPMPLEKPLLQWMHETASWWLLESGVKYLMELES
ncbi:hypothetical protein POX_d05527 [Penicillium oxalicum]|uniref:hypothetical protein n=1 Tax=Penicillium oxalicum TaxID=69781 RepID=UPI0020B642D4|nr:hypothetical protein POX_d05527 [Penicillium oxalicum]KAI2790024.1 hypothetical protein POX_d05527 [Penicillium oxalicum]